MYTYPPSYAHYNPLLTNMVIIYDNKGTLCVPFLVDIKLIIW